jgi:DeoR/GlpR family transcriptional regulator of sugar metabolism
LQEKPIATVRELVDLTHSSEATIRRDISALDRQKKLRRLRGGAETINPHSIAGLAGRPFALNKSVNVNKKRAIAKAAVDMCQDGEAIIINGGTTTFQMVHYFDLPASAGFNEFFSNCRTSTKPDPEHCYRTWWHNLPRTEYHPQLF